jgi:hypothetical protein
MSTYLPRDCTLWEDSSNWNETLKAGLLELALAQMDAMRDWFFWTWKVCLPPLQGRLTVLM